MTGFLRVCLWVLASALISATSAVAQSAPASTSTLPPAHLSLVEGQVSLGREARSETAVENTPLLDGDRIRTDRGRAEIMLGDGSLLHLDQGTTAELLASDLIRLLQGRINIIVLGARDPSSAVRYQVDAPTASAQTNGPGEYRVTAVGDADAGSTELSVVRGDATLADDAGSVDVRAGERAVARGGGAPGRPQYFNSARWDDFDRWSAGRRDEQIGTTSARYLPNDLEPYSGTFDRYGTWRYEASNGYVWFPTVSADWRPYSVGYWRQYDQWDSFWVARDPWGWPTHHYGRWGFSVSFGWYWIPAHSWASSFVYWALGGDYVSWCPLGWNDYPVFGNWGVRGVYVGLQDGWRGWTVIPRRHFGSPVFASHVAIDGRRLDGRSMSAFVAGRRSPEMGHAVPRGQATASLRPQAGSTSGGARGPGAAARSDLAQQRSGATPERYSRRTVPGAPSNSGSDTGSLANARQSQLSNSNAGRSNTQPSAAPRASLAPSPRTAPQSWSQRSSSQPSSSQRSWGQSSSPAAPRAQPRSPDRSTPSVGSRQDRGPSAAPSRGSSSSGGSSAPSSRYNSGSATQRSPSRGTSSQSRRRSAAPE